MTEKSICGSLGFGALFASSNSAEGFKNYYPMIFDRKKLKRLYIIKGGPGTGKSRFMKEVAKMAESKGNCVEYYKCSSDPDSLDGIMINGEIGIVDGTHPHSFDTDIAGAKDEIINLGAFWDGKKLSEKYDDIQRLCDLKQSCYFKGYRYLSGCGEIARINHSLIFPLLLEKKMLGSIARLMSLLPNGEDAVSVPSFTDSIGMKGRVKLDTFELCAEKLYQVIDWYSSAHIYLAAVATAAKQKNIPIRVSCDPINTDRLDGVFLCNSKVAFVIADTDEEDDLPGTRVNMKRFVNKDGVNKIKKEFKNNERLYEALLSSAAEAFAKAGEYHFELEEIYSSCMDFDAKEKFTASFCENFI